MILKEIKEDLELTKFDGVTEVAVYIGGLTKLINVTNSLDWNNNKVEAIVLGLDKLEYLKLSEIKDQILGTRYFKSFGLITIITNGPLDGTIYQYGNYGDSWYQIGQLAGYC